MTLADPFAGTMAARDGGVAWMTIMGIPQGRDQIDNYSSLQSLSEAPADEAWVYACTQKRYAAAASVPLRVYIKAGSERVDIANEPSDRAGTDLQFLLDNINGRDMTGSQFRGYTAASETIWGGCGYKKVRGSLLHDTQELYWLRAPDLTPKSLNGRWVETWDYHPNKGMPEELRPEDVLIFRTFNMASQIDFLSPLSSARYDVMTDRSAAIHTAATLANRGVPEGYWKAQKGTEVTKGDLSAIRRFLRQLRGPRNAGKALVSPDIEYQALSLTPQDAQWLEGRKVSRLMISSVTGVPLLVAGDDDKASVYANFRDAEVAFWKGTVVPTLNNDADIINNWLVPEFDPTRRRLIVAPDYSDVEALKPTFQDETTAWMSFVDHQVATPNMAIRHFRLGPDVAWGDQPVPRTTITLKDSPTTPIAIPATSGDTAPQTPPPTEQGDASPDVPSAIRVYGKALYRHPAVRAFIAHGGPLDADRLLGSRVPDDDRQTIERGLTARHSAATIADALMGVTA